MQKLFLIPIIVFAIYAAVSWTERFSKIDKKLVRRVYYLLCLVWSYFFITQNYDTILCAKIDTAIDINKSIVNTVSTAFILLVFFGIWDFLFISPKSINGFSLKDLSITTEEFTEVAKATEVKYEDFEILQRVTETQYRILGEMYGYVGNLEDILNNELDEIDIRVLYIDILNRYAKYRKEAVVNSFTYNKDGLKTMKEYFRLNDLDFSSIQNCLDLNHVCATRASNNKDRLFAVIKTKFIESDIVVIISGHRIMRNEHFIIQNIISYLDAIIELDIKDMNIEELQNQLSQIN